MPTLFKDGSERPPWGARPISYSGDAVAVTAAERAGGAATGTDAVAPRARCEMEDKHVLDRINELAHQEHLPGMWWALGDKYLVS